MEAMCNQRAKWAIVVFAALLGHGCEGAYTRVALEAVHDDRVVGRWQTEKETDTFTVRRDGDEYLAESQEDKKEKPTRFRLIRVGTTLYVQSGSKPCVSFPSEPECYGLGRLELAGDAAAQLFSFDTAAMFTASVRENFELPYELRRRVNRSGNVETDFLLTGERPELRAFLAKYGIRFTSTAKPVHYRRIVTPKAP